VAESPPCRAASIGAALALLWVYPGCASKDVPEDWSEIASPSELAPAPDPYKGSLSRFGVVPLYAGFSPDPQVVEGTAIGEILASSIHHKCKGWISEIPDYLVDAHTAFFELYVMARSRSDVLLLVRQPDGTVLCNDNRPGTRDPMIRSDFPLGTAQIWIGVKLEGETAAYRLGFSEVMGRSSAVPLPELD
jgi:hypothetical protein